MNPEMPQQPQDESDVQLTALLLGELPHQQAAALHQKLAQDAELAKLYERLKQTINLVRETLATPAAQTADHPTPLKLSEQRREKLLQHFKTIAPKEFLPPRRRGMPWLVPVGIAAAFVVILGGLLLPAFSKAKSRGQSLTFGTLSLSEPAASARLAPPVQNSTRSYQGSIRRLDQSALGAQQPSAGTPIAPALQKAAAPAKPAGTAIVLPQATELADAATTPAAEGVQPGFTVAGTTRGFYDDSLGRAGGMGGGGGFGGGGLGGAGGGVRGEASAQAALGTSSEAGASESRVFRLANGDPSETADQLAQLVPEPTASNSGSQTPMTPFFSRGGPGGQGGNASTAANGGDRTEKRGRVLAVPDPRSSSVIVTAPKNLMPQIADMVTELDSDKGRKEVVGVYNLQNAQPQDVYNNLRDLFNRSNVHAQGNNQAPLLAQNSPLYQREKANTQTTSGGTSTGFGGGGFVGGTSPSSTTPGAGSTPRQYPNNATVGDAFFSIDTETRRVVNVEAQPPAAVPALSATLAPAQEVPSQAVASQPVPVAAPVPAEPALAGKSVEIAAVPFQALGKDKAAGDLTTGLQAAVPGKPATDVLNAGDLLLKRELPGLDNANKLADAAAAGRIAEANPSFSFYMDLNRNPAPATPPAGSRPAQAVELKQALANNSRIPAQSVTAPSETGQAAIQVKKSEPPPSELAATPSDEGKPTDIPVLGNVPLLGKLFQSKAAEGDNRAEDQIAAGAVQLKVEEKAKSVEWAYEGLRREKGLSESERAVGQNAGPHIYSLDAVGYAGVPLTATNAIAGFPAEPSGVDRYDRNTYSHLLSQLGTDFSGASRPAQNPIVLPAAQPETGPVLKDGKDIQLLAAANQSAFTPERPQQQEQKVRDVQEKVDDLRAKLQVPTQANPGPAADVTPPKPAAPAPVPQPEVQTADNAFSTFSLNVSDVSFKLAGASLEKGVMPEAASVRSEEFINAFDYRDPEPPLGVPVAFAWERAQYPFAQNRDLLRFSIKTAALGRQPGRPLNIVLLLDNSGSMERADRVRIIHEALRVLAGQLQPQDIFSVVTFARTAHLWVDGVPGNQAAQVAEEVSGLTPEGGTNLEDAMNLAYQTALRHYLASGVNRVVLLTDGAANLGNVDPEALKQKVEAHRKQGVALDCFGIGWEGYNDDLLEVLARNGDGRYAFLNSPEEVASEFAAKLAGALQVAASDVKVQVEFNPGRVTAYRQIGYAKHQLTKEQFRDNTVNAAQIGAAEAGNALYTVEVNPAGAGPLCTVRVRFRIPGTQDYREHAWDVPFTGNAVALEQASPAMRLAATASALSEWLASSPYAGEVSPDRLLGYLSGVPEVYGADARPKKLEWMIRQAKSISGK